jgi:hypothetical protein
MIRNAKGQIITSEQIIQSRRLLGWTPASLARRAGIAALAAYRIENPECLGRARKTTLLAVRLTLEGAGVDLSSGHARLKHPNNSC